MAAAACYQTGCLPCPQNIGRSDTVVVPVGADQGVFLCKGIQCLTQRYTPAEAGLNDTLIAEFRVIQSEAVVLLQQVSQQCLPDSRR